VANESPVVPHHNVTKELDPCYVRSLRGQGGRRVLRTFAGVFARVDHAAQPVVKPYIEGDAPWGVLRGEPCELTTPEAPIKKARKMAALPD